LEIRNIAIIAHVDHGKTTLIDGLFKQSGIFKSHQVIEERVMDSGDIEKERGITITAKNASFDWKGVTVNIVDTPGHSDFGGEVERALFMVDGVLLLVDSSEGPLPQTRFVLKKALEKNLKVIVVINKVDRTDARVHEVEEKVFDLFCDLALDDNQIEYKTFYASAKNGWASFNKDKKTEDFYELMDVIVEDFPAPKVDKTKPFSMLVTNRIYNSFMGQVAIGRIETGSVKLGQKLCVIDENKNSKEFYVTSIERFLGLKTQKVDKLEAGNIALISGSSYPQIGDTICSAEEPAILPRIKVDPPTVAIRVSVNTSPFAGTEGEYATTRKLEELLSKACLENVSLSMEKTSNPEVYLLKGRGELQLVIVLEELRRKGFELMVGCPEIIPLTKGGSLFEPEEIILIDIPETMVGVVTELVSNRGGVMKSMENIVSSSRVRLEFSIPTRGLFGIRTKMLTETRGEAVFSSSFNRYIPYKGKRFSRRNGAIVADRSGVSVEYGLFHLQSRGKLFINGGVKVYEGMVFGENNKSNDLNANPCKSKKLSNMRASGSDDSTKLNVIKKMELDEALEWIDEDEGVEITPKNIRIRKNQLRTNCRCVIRIGS
jgi:GTP-binding protein